MHPGEYNQKSSLHPVSLVNVAIYSQVWNTSDKHLGFRLLIYLLKRKVWMLPYEAKLNLLLTRHHSYIMQLWSMQFSCPKYCIVYQDCCCCYYAFQRNQILIVVVMEYFHYNFTNKIITISCGCIWRITVNSGMLQELHN